MIRELTDAAEYRQLDALYRDVFAITDGTGLNPRLLMAIQLNSGHVLGAFEGDRLLGFGFSFLARDDERAYQYSQTVAVARDQQSTGIGRRIKYAQRDACLADGLELMRWSFDPMLARNAHVNLDVLGGQVHTFHADMYRGAAPGVTTGEPSDRFVVDWDLRADRVTPSWPEVRLIPGRHVELDGALVVGVPADWHALRDRAGRAHTDPLRRETTVLMSGALERGLVAVSCRRLDDDTAAYLFVERPRAEHAVAA